MERSAFLFGYSAPRLLLGMIVLLFVVAAAYLTLRVWFLPDQDKVISDRLDSWLGNNDGYLKSFLLLIGGLIGSAGFLLAVNTTGDSLGMLPVVFNRASGVFIWAPLFFSQTICLLYLFDSGKLRLGEKRDLAAWISLLRFFLSLGMVLGAASLAGAVIFNLQPLYIPLIILMGVSGLLAVLLWLWKDYGRWALRVFLIALAVYGVVFFAYRATTFLVDRPNTPGKAYFDELADAWLKGQLHLEEPSQTHDLTYFDGKWYVANPPLVAALMVPYVKLFTLQKLNTVVFSIIFGALNASLVFLLLELAARRGWTKQSTTGSLWLTALFAFGTVHWYLAIVGKMWFMSQTVTVTFLAIAALLTLGKKNPLLVGTTLGIAMIARPNILMAWPFLFGFTLQHASDANLHIPWKKMVRWIALSGLPLILAILVLLGYNQARFQNPFDFGYLTENVADFMAKDLQLYGTFHPHFIQRNLRVMFFNLPEFEPACGLIIPKAEGMSMFLATPALFMLIFSFSRKPAVLGAWAAVILQIALIAHYYNTGAWQFGYKYMLDFAVPLIVLLGVPSSERKTWSLRILILFSIAFNAIGVLWWFGKWCVY